jgi:hypothetical protein
MVHTPVHLSLAQQMGIYFSVTQRKIVSLNDFTDLDQLQQWLADTEQRYNATARPTGGSSSRADLDDLLTRIDQQPTASNTIP